MSEPDNRNTEEGQPGILQAALFGCCPRCGARALFVGPIAFAERCCSCDLDLTRFNVGDGPAALVTLVMGGVLVGLAIWLQLAAEPAWWVHVVLWGPLTVVLVLLGLRVCKGFLLTSEYRNRAGEAGRGEQ